MDYDWLTRIPKVKLHVHLEGVVAHDTLWERIQKYGGDPTCPSRESLHQRFEYRDLPHFIETWVWKNNFLREYEDLSFVAERAAEEFARQNIRYVEASYSPGDFARHGLKTQPLDFLAESQIPVGLNPISNVCTGAVESISRHLAKAFLDRGMLVGINTDDPKMFDNSLADEFWQRHMHLGISGDDVRALILNGIKASWQSDDQNEP
jgi:adenosine deaminase